MSVTTLIEVLGEHRDSILVLNAGGSAVMAWVLLWIHRKSLPEQKWVLYFSLGYAVYTGQYILRWCAPFVPLDRFGDFAGILGSTLNNVFFFWAALTLLGLNQKTLRQCLVGVIASASVVAVLEMGLVDLGSWRRVPDVVLSSSCLVVLGVSLASQMRFGHHRRFAEVIFWGAIFYAILHVPYALVPVFVRERLVAEPYDATLFALMLILKGLLFAGAFSLVARSLELLRPGIFREALKSITEGHAEFLSSSGVVRSIARLFDADLCEICLRVPGQQKKRVVWWRWVQERKSSNTEGTKNKKWKSFEIDTLPTIENSRVGVVLEAGDPVTIEDLGEQRKRKIPYRTKVPGMNSLVAVPVCHHSTIIGVVNLEWRKPKAFTKTMVLQIQQLTDLLAPVLQAQRQLSALDKFGYMLPRLELNSKVTQKPLSSRVDLVHDTLAPLATGICLDIGFQSRWAARSDDCCIGDQIPADTSLDLYEHLCDELNGLVETGETWKRLEDLGKHAGVNKERFTRTVRERLVVRDQRLGELVLIYPSKELDVFDRSRAMLGTDYLHRRTVGSVVADALLDATRIELSNHLAVLQTDLSQRTLKTPRDWWTVVDRRLKAVGFAWVVARTAGSEHLFGPDEVKTVVRSLVKQSGEPDLEHPYLCYDFQKLVVGAQHVIALALPASGAYLWLGVPRKGFGTELRFPSPWKVFLERLADVAGAALLWIVATHEFERMALDQARKQGLITTLVSKGTMTHELANFARGFSSGMNALHEGVQLGDLKGVPSLLQMISSMRTSTQELERILKPLTTITALDERRPCDLREVVQVARDLYSISIEQQVFQFLVDFEGLIDDSRIDVPFHVATLAVANLISNALDARNSGGVLEVKAWQEEGSVLCSVTDDGPGIPDVIRKDIFHLGVTTKEGSGGWGLYLTSNSLVENQAKLELTSTGSSGTIFTIFFPPA